MRTTLMAALLVALGASAAPAADPAVCAAADARYAKLPDDVKAPPGTAVVKMYQYTFCPPALTVPVGTTVRWVNVERTSHSVWLQEAGEPESDRVFVDEWWEFTFAAPGTYPYLCGPHWEKERMVGAVTVVPR